MPLSRSQGGKSDAPIPLCFLWSAFYQRRARIPLSGVPGEGPHSRRGGTSSKEGLLFFRVLRELWMRVPLIVVPEQRAFGAPQQPVNDFLTLGVETSCDDTAFCVLAGSRKILSNVLSSQVADHAPFGGVIPELASRKHQEVFLPLLDQALRQAGIRNPSRELDLVAVTMGPGLMGSLLVGVMGAKALAQAWELPLVGVNHLEGHLFANVVFHEDLAFPFLALIVSGGHTEIVLARAPGDYVLLGATRDDAAGEAYDKVAKLLGLAYPGGPVVDRLAQEGDPLRFSFPVPMAFSDEIAFSFSGLKTAVLWETRRWSAKGKPLPKEDLCASFQRTVVEALLTKVRLAVKRTGVRRVTLSGGVAANSALRRALEREPGFRAYVPPISLCTDNAAMIAAAGYAAYRRGYRCDLSLSPDPVLPLTPWRQEEGLGGL